MSGADGFGDGSRAAKTAASERSQSSPGASGDEEFADLVGELACERARVLQLEEGLRELVRAFCRMPDAGLSNDDPRYAWWFETLPERDAARALLDRKPEASS